MLKDAIRVVPTSTTRQALKYVFIKATERDNRVDICTSNEELSVKMTLFDTTVDSPVTIFEPGTCLLPARELYDIVKVANTTVSLERTDSPMVIVQVGRTKYELNGLEPRLFQPYTNDKSSTTSVVIQAMALRELLHRTTYACHRGEARPILTGALFQLENESLNTVGTDGMRLSCATIEKLEIDGEPRVLPIPYESLDRLQALLPAHDDDEPVTLEVGDTSLIATWSDDGMRVMMRGLDGSFPNVQNIIPDKQTYTYRFQRQELLAACERVDILCDSQQSHKAELVFRRNELVMNGEWAMYGSAMARVDVQQTNSEEEITALFNLSYWIQALKSYAPDEFINVHISAPNRPVTLSPDTGESIALIAPMFRSDHSAKSENANSPRMTA